MWKILERLGFSRRPAVRRSEDSPPESPGSAAARERRRSTRRPIGDVFVVLEAAQGADTTWITTAVDINRGGVGLALPPGLEPGTEVLASFTLDGNLCFAKVPSVIVRGYAGAGAIAFRPLPEEPEQLLGRFLTPSESRALAAS